MPERWRLKWNELRSEDPDLEDASLGYLRQVHLDGQLDAFVCLELYTEEYRNSFERWKKDNREKAIRYLEDQVLGQNQVSMPGGYNASAVQAYRDGAAIHDSNPAQAALLYEKALKQEPYMLPALEAASYLYMNLERYADARETAGRWLELAPDSPRPLDVLAIAFIKEGEFRKALPVLERAIELEQDPAQRERLETISSTAAIKSIESSRCLRGCISQRTSRVR